MQNAVCKNPLHKVEFIRFKKHGKYPGKKISPTPNDAPLKKNYS